MKFEIPQLRCCFCMSLRRAIITLGFINIVLSALLIGTCSYFIHLGVYTSFLDYKPYLTPAEIVPLMLIYCIQLLANISLIYGAQNKNVLCLKMFYYYTLSTAGAALVFYIHVCVESYWHVILYLTIFTLPTFCCQAYLMILVRSLLINLETPNTNQFHERFHDVTGVSETGNDFSKNENDRKNRDTYYSQEGRIYNQ